MSVLANQISISAYIKYVKTQQRCAFLIVEELQNDKKSLHSCLLVDRTWCETTIPILWKNPRKFCPCPIDSAESILLFNVILLHLSEESRENLKKQKIDLFAATHQRPLFNYISFWRYLNLYFLEGMMLKRMMLKRLERVTTEEEDSKESQISILRNEIMRLFINRNTKFTHLYLNSDPYFQIHHIPGAEHCFSELKFIQCDIGDKTQNDLERLAEICKSVKTLELIKITSMTPDSQYNSGIVKLIEAQKNLNDVQINFGSYNSSIYKTFEELLVKNVDTIQYLKLRQRPTKFLSNLVNLISLDINTIYYPSICNYFDWSHLENAYLPVLKILKASWVPSKSLVSLIKNTKGHLTEISINYAYLRDIQIIIQSIYQNCPNLIYLKFHLIPDDSNISEWEKLLINCQCLNGLFIDSYGTFGMDIWDDLFKILTKSSPTGLFKFKFRFNRFSVLKLESLKLFFDNWKGRHPMLLQIIPAHQKMEKKYFDLIEKYKMEGIIKKYNK